MQRAMFENFFNGLDRADDWDYVILQLESYLGFWKQMYCGIYEATPWEQELASAHYTRTKKRRRRTLRRPKPSASGNSAVE